MNLMSLTPCPHFFRQFFDILFDQIKDTGRQKCGDEYTQEALTSFLGSLFSNNAIFGQMVNYVGEEKERT